MKITALSTDELSALSDGLNLASKLAKKPKPLSELDVQNLYDEFLQTSLDFQEGIIALGLSFGQLLLEEDNFEWVRVADEYGEETVISPKGSMTICAPISMIQKRLQKKENLDIRNFKTHLVNNDVRPPL